MVYGTDNRTKEFEIMTIYDFLVTRVAGDTAYGREITAQDIQAFQRIVNALNAYPDGDLNDVRNLLKFDKVALEWITFISARVK
jgi:hypothetical protein